jgi:hypothetical protein
MKPHSATVVLATICASIAAADTVHISLFEIESRGLMGDPNNMVLVIDVADELGLPSGTPAIVTGVGYDISLSNRGSTLLADTKAYFDDNISPDGVGVHIWPAEGDTATGWGSYDSGGIMDTDDVPLPDGMLRIDFYELNDDYPGQWDTFWNGSLQVEAVPEPTPVLLACVGTLFLRRR